MIASMCMPLPPDWHELPVQLPLFIEHKHSLRLTRIRWKDPACLEVRWRGVKGDELEGTLITERFDLSQRAGRGRFKGLILAIWSSPIPRNSLELSLLKGRKISAIVVSLRTGTSTRRQILHHTLH